MAVDKNRIKVNAILGQLNEDEYRDVYSYKNLAKSVNNGRKFGGD
jgi:hypothetical protein